MWLHAQRCGLALLCAALLVAASSHVAAQTIDISNWGLAVSSNLVSVNRNSVVEGSILVITRDEFSQGGSAFLREMVDVSKDFRVEFGYLASGSCGAAADGLSLVFQPSSAQYSGLDGLNLGMNPNSKLFGVWIDAFANGEQGDVSGFAGRWHLGLARSQQVYWRIKDPINSNEVCGRGSPANITITYERTNLQVYLNDVLVPELSTTISISNLIGQSRSFVGFTGSTGGAKIRQEIHRLKMTYLNTDSCATFSNCSSCTSSQCAWCSSSNTCQLGATASCSRSCPRPRPPVASPAPPTTPAPPPTNPCLGSTSCSACLSPLCVWGISVSQPQGVCIPRSSTEGFTVFSAPDQCSRVCSTFASCTECTSLGRVRGCGWCGKPTSGGPRCLHSSETAASCSSPLNSVCDSITKCSIFAGEGSISGSSVIGTANFAFMYSGNGSTPVRYTLVARYRSTAGSLVQSVTVNSSSTNLPAVSAPGAVPFTVPFSFTIPSLSNGVPELTIDASVSTADSDSLKCAASSRPLLRPTEPQLSLSVTPSSIFTKTATDIRLRVLKKGGAENYAFDSCEWFLGAASLGRTGSNIENFSTRFNSDRIVAPGQYQFVANCTFSFSGFTSARSIRRSISATDISKVYQDSFFLPSPKVQEKPEEKPSSCRDPSGECFDDENKISHEVSSDLRFNIGTDKDLNLIVVKTGLKFNLDVIASFKYTPVKDRGVRQIAGFANTQYSAEATIEIEIKEVFLIKGSISAAFEWKAENGKFEPEKRTITGSLELRRVWTPKLSDRLPKLVRDRVKIELQLGIGIRVSLIFKPAASNPSCTGIRLGSWVQCPPFEVIPFLVAEGVARVGGRWAGFEAAASIEINAVLRFGPFRLAAITVPLKFEAKAWLGFLRKSYTFQRTICVVGGACGKRADDDDEVTVIPGAEVPMKSPNPGSFIDTVVTSANEYIVLDDYAETISLASVAMDRFSKNFALSVWAARDTSNNRPTNYHLVFSHILSTDGTPDGVSFSEADVIAEIDNADVSDTNPAVSWMPSTDGEFLLVWTRIQNASFVNTAPVSANGSIMLTDEESAALLLSTSVVWATFKPGYGWTERGRITDDPLTLTSGAVSSRTDLYHPVYQPIIVAYESSRVSVNSTASDIQLLDTKLMVSKFESSSLEMSAPLPIAELAVSPARVLVASWGQHHNLVYEVTEFNGTADVPRIYYKTFGWNLTSNGTFPTRNMMAAPSNNGIPTPPCLLGSIGSIAHFAWANNFTATESLDASELRFVLTWTCGPELWMGVIDPSSTQLTSFEVILPVAGDNPIVSWAHNETHLTLTRWARELRTSSSAYYMQSVPLSVFPPSNAMFKNAPSVRHARTTVQEDDLFTGYFQNDLMLVVSKDNLLNQKLSDGSNSTTRTTTTSVVKRRIVSAVFGSNQESEQILNVVCSNATYSLSSSSSLDTVVSFLCQSNKNANVSFNVLTGDPESGEESVQIGVTTLGLSVGSNSIQIPVFSDLLMGGLLVIDSDAPAFEPLRIDGPPLDTEIRVVPGTVEQLSLDPVMVQLDVRNFGITPPEAISISAYLESGAGRRILVGQYDDDDEENMPGLGDQRTYEIPLWGIDTQGVFEVSFSVYDSLDSTYPIDTIRVSVEFRRTASITLLPHDLVPSAGSVRVAIPAGDFFPTIITLVDVSTQQSVDERELEEFSIASNITLSTSSASGPFVVCSSLVSMEETPEQLLENGLCTPVPFRPLPRLANSFAFLGLSAPDVRQVNTGSQLYYVVRPPRLSAPWGVMIRASGSKSIPSMAVSTTFLDASVSDVGGLPIYRQPYLSAAAAFSSFGELSSVDSSTLYVSVHSSVSDTISAELSMVQFVDIDDAEPLLCDASAPILFALKPGRQGSATLMASRDMAGAKMYLSTTGYAFGSGEGIVQVPGALSVFNNTIQIPMSFENGTTYFVDELDAVVETKWTLANLTADQIYFVSLIAGDSAAAPFSLTVDVSDVQPKKLSSCPIQVNAAEAVPVVKAATLASGQIEVEISMRDEITNSKNSSRLDDVSVTFGSLPQCVWRLKDPLMLATWTQVKSADGATCGRRIFSRVFDATDIGGCFASTKRSMTSGALNIVRTYRIAGSSQPQLVVTVSNLMVDRSIAPVVSAVPSAAVAQVPSTQSDTFTDRPGFVGGIVFLVIVAVVLIGVIVFLLVRNSKRNGVAEAPLVPVKPAQEPPQPQPSEQVKTPKKRKPKVESSSSEKDESESTSKSASSSNDSSELSSE